MSKSKSIHTEDGTFQCSSCSKRFSKPSNANSHVKNCQHVIKSKKDHSCAVSKKLFKYESPLKRHLKSRENVKSSSAKKFINPLLNSDCNEIDMEDDFLPSLCFCNTNFHTVSNNDSDSDVFSEPQETGNEEDIVPTTPIKESSGSQTS